MGCWHGDVYWLLAGCWLLVVGSSTGFGGVQDDQIPRNLQQPNLRIPDYPSYNVHTPQPATRNNRPLLAVKMGDKSVWDKEIPVPKELIEYIDPGVRESKAPLTHQHKLKWGVTHQTIL